MLSQTGRISIHLEDGWNTEFIFQQVDPVVASKPWNIHACLY
jgi:hypothetical protein